MDANIEKRVKHAWVKEYGEGGDRQGQKTLEQYKAEPYHGRGTGASMSHFKARRAVKAQKTQDRGKGRDIAD